MEIREATEIVREAIQLDEDGKYAEAFDMYLRALERFSVVMKWEKNPATRDALRTRVTSYLTRAEEIERELTKAAESTSSVSSGSATTTASSTRRKTTVAAEESDEHLRSAIHDTIVVESPNVRWSDVVGLEEAKTALYEAVVYPRKFPHMFTGLRRPWSGILLYGPPGTGKSFLAKAAATEIEAVFFSVSSSDIVSKWQGESERLVKHLFKAAKSQKKGVSIVFIDEVDSLCGSRTDGEDDSTRRIKTQFLVQMNDLTKPVVVVENEEEEEEGNNNNKSHVLVLAATNTPWSLDAGMRRRFEKRIYVPLPSLEARVEMFRKFMRDTPHSLTEEDFITLARETEGYSGADIETVGRAAAFEPLRAMERITRFRVSETDGFYEPVFESCERCDEEVEGKEVEERRRCEECGAIRTSLMSVPNGRIRAVPVSYENFKKALSRTPSTVAPSELTRFAKWTAEFGSER